MCVNVCYCMCVFVEKRKKTCSSLCAQTHLLCLLTDGKALTVGVGNEVEVGSEVEAEVEV